MISTEMAMAYKKKMSDVAFMPIILYKYINQTLFPFLRWRRKEKKMLMQREPQSKMSLLSDTDAPAVGQNRQSYLWSCGCLSVAAWGGFQFIFICFFHSDTAMSWRTG